MIALDLSAERWAEVNRLLDDALDRPATERDAFLVDRCGDDEELLRAVTSVLTASEEAGDEPTGPAAALLEAAFGLDAPPNVPGSREGESIGRYRLTRELGQGGMATVYEAERADGSYERRVALKLLRPGSLGADIAERFRRERQILSSLEHPNIAMLLDGGETEDRTPYLVMELVDGEPITEWAERQNLSLAARLELFEQVIEAVEFAHRRLIVHRDLKPSNVLVTEQGRVKLLDFGIAKLVDPGLDDLETRPATRWMTPSYASPEQIRGEAITTASDVYALGVLLFELLSGVRPFGREGLSAFELERAICEKDPPRPSSVATDPKIATGLEGDLDAILLRALRKEPEQRYGSAARLLDDLRRHRDGFPVDAHDGVWGYRTRKFVSRHRVGVGAAALLAGVMMASSALVWRQQRIAVIERDRATEEAENSRLVIGFLSDVFRGDDPTAAPSDTVTARELLAWGRERVDTEFGDRPALQAELVAVLGGAYANLGLVDDSRELWREAVRLRQELYGPESEEVADALTRLGNAAALGRNFIVADTMFAEALRIREKNAAGRPDTLVASSLITLGRTRAQFQELDEAERYIRRAIEIRRVVLSDTSMAYTEALLALAPVRRAQGDLSEAADLYERAIPQFRNLGGEGRDLAAHTNNLAFLKASSGAHAEAAILYREALDIHSPIYGRGHPNTIMIAGNLASVLQNDGREDESLALLRGNVEAARAQYPDGHWRVGQANTSLGNALLQAGLTAEAATALVEGARLYTTLLGDQHEWTQFALASLSVARVLEGQTDAGQPYLDRFDQWIEETWDPLDPVTRTGRIPLMRGLLNVYRATGFDEAADLYEALLATADAPGASGR